MPEANVNGTCPLYLLCFAGKDNRKLKNDEDTVENVEQEGFFGGEEYNRVVLHRGAMR